MSVIACGSITEFLNLFLYLFFVDFSFIDTHHGTKLVCPNYIFVEGGLLRTAHCTTV